MILRNRNEDWHAWFAWHPVAFTYSCNKIVWMERVARRWNMNGYGAWWVYEPLGILEHAGRGATMSTIGTDGCGNSAPARCTNCKLR